MPLPSDEPNPPRSNRSSAARAGRPFGRRVVLGVVVVAVLLLVGAGWVGIRAWMAKSELERALPLASAIQSDIIAGRDSSARAASQQLSAHARKAAELTSDPIWHMFEVVPFLGPNLTAFRELSSAVEDVNANGVQPLTELAGGMNLTAFKPVNGAIDLKPLVAAQPKIAQAEKGLERASRALDAIDTTGTISPIQSSAARLRALVTKATDSVVSVNRAATLLPPMLGADGPRKYVVLFQNNAELRATGGLPGALALVETDSGHISLTSQTTGSSFGRFPSPVMELPAETRGLFSDRLTTYMGDVTLTPSFPTTGAIVREMWKKKYGDDIDGVISLDPIALSYLLRSTGPLTLPTGDVLTSGNAVHLLLSDVYAKYNKPADQDAFFAGAASSVFSALANGRGAPAGMISALAQAGDEHRIYVWSAHDGDQSVLTGTTLAGGLPVSDASADRFGIYLNDATGAKMDTYLDVHTGLGQVTCRKDGRPYYAVDVTLTNTAPADAATSLPSAVTGPGVFGVAKGNIKTLILVYGPKDAQNLGVTRASENVPYHPASDSGYPVSQLSVELAPGQSSTTRFFLLGGKKNHGTLEAVETPVIKLQKTQALDVSCGSVPR